MNEEQIIKESLSTFYRLFFDFIPQVMSDLKHGINYVKQSTQNHTYRGVKGRRFDNESTFILENKARNGGRAPEIKSTTVKSGRKDLKMLVKACKNRGVDVYIREKPSNLLCRHDQLLFLYHLFLLFDLLQFQIIYQYNNDIFSFSNLLCNNYN